MKTMNKRSAAVLAVLAAVFYGINVPVSKRLTATVAPTMMAGLLYLGAGLGIGILYIFNYGKEDKDEQLTKADLPYTLAMIVLDIMAPIFLMLGISIGTSANASLLGNFEIVATTVIALLLFREKISGKLWTAIMLITVSSIILSFEGVGSFTFSLGSLFVILATCCWGFENNCTRKISGKSTYEIVVLKGFFSGGGSLTIAFLIGEQLPSVEYVLAALLLGFVAYGLSIFLYVRAQRIIGAAKTSAFYAVAPFIGGGLSILMNGDPLTFSFGIALLIMIVGTVFVVRDTMDGDNGQEKSC